MKKIFLNLAFLSLIFNLGGCSKSVEFVTWQEEVKLNDGRVLTVTHRKRCESGYAGQNWSSCIEREGWISFSLPEFSAKEISWQGGLDLLILNVYHDHLYLIGIPMHLSDYRFYDEPESFYAGFIWKGKDWSRIRFEEIPKEIYDTNMLITNIPPPWAKSISLIQKIVVNLMKETTVTIASVILIRIMEVIFLNHFVIK